MHIILTIYIAVYHPSASLCLGYVKKSYIQVKLNVDFKPKSMLKTQIVGLIYVLVLWTLSMEADIQHHIVIKA